MPRKGERLSLEAQDIATSIPEISLDWFDGKKRKEETRRRRSEAAKKLWEDPEFRARQAEASKTRKSPKNKQPSSRADHLVAANKTPEARALQSERAKAMWQDPEFRERYSAARRNSPRREEISQNASEKMKELWQDPAFREKQLREVTTEARRKGSSEHMKRLWQDSEWSEQMRQKTGERARELWQDPAYRENQLSKMKVRKLTAKGVCVYCGDVAVHMDHNIPIDRGGTNEASNLVPACGSCNSSKGRLTGEEYRDVRRRKGLVVL